MALPVSEGTVSDSLTKLHDLGASFESLVDGRPLRQATEKKAIKLATVLGPTAVPLLERKLFGASDAAASWAYTLLARIGGPRVVAVARRLARAAQVSDDRKALALALMAELGEEPPDDVVLADAEGLKQRSVAELLDSLAEPSDVARAASILLAEIEPDQMAAFLADMADTAGGRVLVLVRELLLRTHLPDVARDGLAKLHETLLDGSGAPEPSYGGAPRRQKLLAGVSPGGARVFVALRRERGDAGTGVRALVVRLDAHGGVVDVCYDAALPPRTGERRLLGGLQADGYALAPTRRPMAARAIAEAMRKLGATGQALPDDYYLGRDLVGLTDEHVPNRASPDGAGAELLARAIELAEHRHVDRALALLERYVGLHPDDAEGHALLGSLLIEREDLGQAPSRLDDAIKHLAIAGRLEPDDAAHAWNLAHAHKRAGRLGACFLALRRYLALPDRTRGAQRRRASAREYAQLFERYARLEHPDAPVERVARAEEAFEAAYDHLLAGRLDQAIDGFEAVLKVVPSHYPSWGNLGVAHATREEKARAELCLRKALEVRPGYELARRNLLALVE